MDMEELVRSLVLSPTLTPAELATLCVRLNRAGLVVKDPTKHQLEQAKDIATEAIGSRSMLFAMNPAEHIKRMYLARN